ncbi:hypothetical protein CDA56_11415 [Klebsiella michiganensis]|nr:hypothetical protein CDA56_11415 [Klebsiella michiganensis]
MINSVCRWHQRQLISKWCGILLQLLLLCKAPTRFLKGTFIRTGSIHEVNARGEESFIPVVFQPAGALAFLAYPSHVLSVRSGDALRRRLPAT